MRVVLAVVGGPHRGQSFTFPGHDTFLVGRSPRAHFRLPEKDEFFSRLHFLVEVNPPHCRLLDLGSTNGTCVNGRRVSLADLADGDLVQAGQTVLRVCLEGDGSGPPTRVLAAPAPPPEAPSLTTTVDFLAGPLAQGCPGCGTPPGPGEPGAGNEPPRPVTVCAACREKARVRPQPVPGYLVIRELGRGGMGVVSLALREADGGAVALKTLTPAVDATPGLVERFLREADILRQLDHPHVVAFRDLGEAGGRLFFAMDFVPGGDAAGLLRREGPLDVRRAVGLVCQLLEALEYAHGRGFVHRDVKPANLLVATEAGREVVRVTDFGLARVYQASRLSGLSVAGQVGGTLPFMPPEQITRFREARPAADQYAAAATLYNLLTDRFPFDFPAAVQQRLLMVLQQEPVPLRTRRPDVPEALAAAVHRALAKEPVARFPDVARMRQALLPHGE